MSVGVEYEYHARLKAAPARSIQTEDEAGEQERTAHCDKCQRLVAVVTALPEQMPPLCERCLSEEIANLRAAITQVHQRVQATAEWRSAWRKYTIWLYSGRVFYWIGAVAFGVLLGLNIESGDYWWAALDAAMLVFYLGFFWNSFRTALCPDCGEEKRKHGH